MSSSRSARDEGETSPGRASGAAPEEVATAVAAHASTSNPAEPLTGSAQANVPTTGQGGHTTGSSTAISTSFSTGLLAPTHRRRAIYGGDHHIDLSNPPPASTQAFEFQGGDHEREAEHVTASGGRGRGQVQGRGTGTRAGVSSGIPISRSAAMLGRGARPGDAPSTPQQTGPSQSSHSVYGPLRAGSASSRRLTDRLRPTGPSSSPATRGHPPVSMSASRQLNRQGAGSASDHPGPLTSNPVTPHPLPTSVSSGNFNRPTPRQGVGSISNHPGPLSSNPATPFALPSSVSQGDFHKQTPGRLRPSMTTSNLPRPSISPQRADTKGKGVSQSNIPAPKFGLPHSATTAALSRLNEENVPPIHSSSSLGARARDSLLLPNTQNVPKKQKPSAKQHVDRFTPESAPTIKLVQQNLAPIAESQPRDNTAPTPKRNQQQEQQPASSSAQQQEQKGKPAGLPASQPSSSKLPLPRQTGASRAKEDVLTDLPSSNPQQSKGKSKQPSGLPRSRTLGIFSNLTASLSRTSLGRHAASRAASRKQSSSSLADSNMSDPNRPGSGEGASVSQASTTLRDDTPLPRGPSAAGAAAESSTPPPVPTDRPHHLNSRLVYEVSRSTNPPFPLLLHYQISLTRSSGA
ncbi:hypothetical protein GGR52DRAFT_533087 [Hypoxylon sp. FL1284]|nr:hypothetical protein GGR52DRAFT_533087 [Hypoxylon sp. FL1284]